MFKRKTGLLFDFPENSKRDANLPSTDSLSFDDLGDFIEERERVKRALERNVGTVLKVDYSNFDNHVFYDSAYQKYYIAQNRILKKYPFNSTAEEKEAFFLTGSGFENYVYDILWPKYVGNITLQTGSVATSNPYVSASDYDGKLNLGSSSLYVSMWMNNVKVGGQQDMTSILQVLSASVGSLLKYGYEFYISSSAGSNATINFNLYSGSQLARVSSSYTAFTGSANNVAAIYDQIGDLLSLYINETKVFSTSVVFGPIEFQSAKVFVGSGSQYVSSPTVSASYNFFSGTIDEIRILHTASDLYHIKNFNRTIDSEDYVMLKYSFNEGIVGTGSVDSVVVDYSQNGIHGKIVNYTSTIRSSGTFISSEEGDPILYSFHSGVMALSSTMFNSASIYDENNPNFIMYQLPEYVIEQDNRQEGLLTTFSLAMARYFDDIKSYIDQFENVRITNYKDLDETPDVFLPYLKRYFGWKVTEHFNNANPLEFFFGENVITSGSLEVPLIEIRNQFWKRILNNLPYLYATKGKRNNIDAFFNVLGINKNVLSIKEYGYLPGRKLTRH